MRTSPEIEALRTLELAAELIADGPQTGPQIVAALRLLAGHAARWRLVYLWKYLQFDAKAEPNRLIGAQQNLGAALNGIALALKVDRLDPVALAHAKDQTPPTG